MSIFLHELRKIFNWRVLALLLPIGFIFYFMYIDFHFEHFPNGSEVYDYTIHQQMVELYGNEMDARDRADFKERHEDRLAQADDYIANHPEAQALGVSTYEEVWSAEPEHEGVWELSSQLMDEADGLFWYVQAERSVIAQFDHHADNEPMTTAQYERIQEVIAEGENVYITGQVLKQQDDEWWGIYAAPKGYTACRAALSKVRVTAGSIFDTTIASRTIPRGLLFHALISSRRAEKPGSVHAYLVVQYVPVGAEMRLKCMSDGSPALRIASR
jgi:hypothetical protein